MCATLFGIVNRATASKPRPRAILSAFAACVLVIFQLGTVADADAGGHAGGRAIHADPLVGTWDVMVNITNCNTGDVMFSSPPALALFNADGTRHETNASSPALRTPGYGNWRRVAKNHYQFAFKFFRFDGTGANIGSTSVRHDLYLSADKQSYYSEGPAEFMDTAGNVLFTACANATATRYK